METNEFEYKTNRENKVYEETKEFGRIQFVREIIMQQNENENLRATIKTYNGIANALCKKNENLKQQLKDKDEKINKIEKLTKQLKGSARYERCMDELDYILNIIKED